MNTDIDIRNYTHDPVLALKELAFNAKKYLAGRVTILTVNTLLKLNSGPSFYQEAISLSEANGHFYFARSIKKYKLSIEKCHDMSVELGVHHFQACFLKMCEENKQNPQALLFLSKPSITANPETCFQAVTEKLQKCPGVKLRLSKSRFIQLSKNSLFFKFLNGASRSNMENEEPLDLLMRKIKQADRLSNKYGVDFNVFSMVDNNFKIIALLHRHKLNNFLELFPSEDQQDRPKENRPKEDAYIAKYHLIGEEPFFEIFNSCQDDEEFKVLFKLYMACCSQITVNELLSVYLKQRRSDHPHQNGKVPSCIRIFKEFLSMLDDSFEKKHRQALVSHSDYKDYIGIVNFLYDLAKNNIHAAWKLINKEEFFLLCFKYHKHSPLQELNILTAMGLPYINVTDRLVSQDIMRLLSKLMAILDSDAKSRDDLLNTLLSRNQSEIERLFLSVDSSFNIKQNPSKSTLQAFGEITECPSTKALDALRVSGDTQSTQPCRYNETAPIKPNSLHVQTLKVTSESDKDLVLFDAVQKIIKTPIIPKDQKTKFETWCKNNEINLKKILDNLGVDEFIRTFSYIIRLDYRFAEDSERDSKPSYHVFGNILDKIIELENRSIDWMHILHPVQLISGSQEDCFLKLALISIPVFQTHYRPDFSEFEQVLEYFINIKMDLTDKMTQLTINITNEKGERKPTFQDLKIAVMAIN